MRYQILNPVVTVFCIICCEQMALSQENRPAALPAGTIILPESSVRRPQALAVGLELQAKAYTNVAVFVPAIFLEPPTATAASAPGYYVETPASIACIYGLVPRTGGCDPNVVKANVSGGARKIVIVDAYHAPNVKSDLAVFSQRFGLPPADVDVIFASGKPPRVDKGWELEISLDVEWAHAMAPGAAIVLIEADSNSYDDLLLAEDKASALLQPDGGEVSNSWGGPEFAGETAYDKHFAAPGVVYFAATGDTPGVSYPSTSIQVIAVGGTSIIRDDKGAFLGEASWENAGGGRSAFEARPPYQSSIVNLVGSVRGVPDVSAIADPTHGGVWVYDAANPNASTNKGWVAVGGTSVATPIIAAITNNSGTFRANGQDELMFIYKNLGANGFSDIDNGQCGPSKSFNALRGWDFCTGVGSPNGNSAF